MALNSEPAYRILDLFCGAGGAAKGYHRAGFEVVGVDLEPQPNYPYAFVQMDALLALTTLLAGGCITDTDGRRYYLRDFDAIHASPPCQDYSATRHMRGGETKYPRLIAPVRELLILIGLPYVIENVEMARPDMRDPVKLCGSMFGLTAPWHGDTVYLQRHRLFEANFPIAQKRCDHSAGKMAVTVAGHGRCDMGEGRGDYFAGRGYAALTRAVMGIDWMTRDELNESIPPAYAFFVGCQLALTLRSMRTVQEAAA